MAVDGRIYKPGRFLTHRNLTGAAATDSATINDTNYPPASAFNAGGSRSVWLVWNGAGGTSSDTITVVPLVRDGINALWNQLASVVLTRDRMAEYYLYGAGAVFLMITAVSTTATALQVRVALANSEIVE
jgi:hypothetical protein